MLLKKVVLSVIIGLCVIGAGCETTLPPSTDIPTSTNQNTPTTPATSTTKSPFGDDLQITSVDVLMLESFPVQVMVNIEGNVNKCVKLNEPKVTQEENVFYVAVSITELATGKTCSPTGSVTFKKSVSLDVAGLKKGTYEVYVNKMKKTFTLDMDNFLSSLPEETGGLVGTWKIEEGQETFKEITLKDDNSVVLPSQTGTWSFANNTLSLYLYPTLPLERSEKPKIVAPRADYIYTNIVIKKGMKGLVLTGKRNDKNIRWTRNK